MRSSLLIILLALLCCLLQPVLAVDTPEATVTRVHELEKANLVLQHDLARTQLELDISNQKLKKTQEALNANIAQLKALSAQLDQEAAARKALDDKLTKVQQQLADDIAASRKEMAIRVFPFSAGL